MATINKFPPDVPKDWDEAADDAAAVAGGIREKVVNAADRAAETVRDGYSRAKASLADIDPAETAREAGDAVVDVVERHPLAVLGLGAVSVGLIAWAAMRRPTPAWEPAVGTFRQWFNDHGGPDAMRAGESALKRGQSWFADNSDAARDYGQSARDYAISGGRYLAKRGEREPLAAVVGIGLALYVVGSLLTSSSQPAAANRKRTTSKRA